MTSTPLLSIEIRTLEPSDPEFQEYPTITIFQDEHNNYFLGSGLREIETIILAMIGYLDTTSYLYSPFRLQILKGSQLDAFLYKARHESPSRN